MTNPARRTPPTRVGIEKIQAYPCALGLDLEALGQARGREPGYARNTLNVESRGVNPCFEDPVTMGVNAAAPMLSDADRQDIELLIVGTESSSDQGKPISTFVHRHLRIQPHCRNFETKHACYSGTSAMMMAAHWVASGVAPGKKALVVCTDQARMNLGESYEFVLGAGAVALLISDTPDVLELELDRTGYWTHEVSDTFRPTSREEGGNTDNSLYCYLDALEGSYAHFRERAGPLDYDKDFAGHVYHQPFSAMARRAHRTVLRLSEEIQVNDFAEHFDRKVLPSLRYNAQVGSVYSGSTFFALMGLLRSNGLQAGDPITVFSYGSGSCAEFYSARVGARAREVVQGSGIEDLLEERDPISVEDYESIERERDEWIDCATYQPRFDVADDVYTRRYRGRGRLVLRSVDGHFRHYDWS